jgi:hypothetical protein
LSDGYLKYLTQSYFALILFLGHYYLTQLFLAVIMSNLDQIQHQDGYDALLIKKKKVDKDKLEIA